MSRILYGQNRYQLSEERLKEIEHREAQPAKFSCAFCGWKYEGTVSRARKLARAHREKKHPETLNLPTRKKRGVSALTTFRYASMDEQSIREIQDERRKRAFLNGVEIVE